MNLAELQTLPAAAAPSSGMTLDQLNNLPPAGATPTPTPTPDTSSGGVGGFLKSLVSAPVTLLARPFQAVAELAGVPDTTVNQFSNKISGGIIAPTPQNYADVKKDVGRAVQTISYGLGPAAGGAGIGFGTSLEQGNDIFSIQTALDTALGAAGGKVLGLIGKPIFNAAGKAVAEVTPQFLKELTQSGTKAILDFAAQHEIFPEATSKFINNTAQTVENAVNLPFDAIGNAAKSTYSKVANSSVVQNTIDKVLPQTPERLSAKETAVINARENIANEYQKSLPLTPTQLSKEINLKAKTGDNVFTTLAKHDINLGSPDAISQLTQVSDQFANATQHAQANERAFFNVDEIKANAFSHVDSQLSSETARTAAKNKIEDEINALLKANKSSVVTDVNGNTTIDSNLVERLRRTGNSWTPFNASDPEKIGKSAGFALSNAVRDQVEKQGTFPAYREANKEWGKIIHAQEVVQKIQDSGKAFKTPGGLSNAIARRVLSGALGFHTAGLGGAVLAELGSDYAAKILANPELRTYFDRKLIQNFDTKVTPESIVNLEKEVKAFVDSQANMKALPAPAIQLPSAGQSIQSKVQTVPAKKVLPTQNPKTGKMQTTYSSTP